MVKTIYVEKKYNCHDLLGTFLTKKDYDVLLDEDVDVYGPSLDGSMTEDNIVAKFRKNIFSPDVCASAYNGLREAATQSQNRGMAAGPRGERLSADGRGGRDWVTQFQIDVLDWLCRPENILDDSITLYSLRQKHQRPIEDVRGFVWLRSKVLADYNEYDGWFERWLADIMKQPRKDQKQAAEYVRENYISDTNYAQSVMSGVAGYYGRYPRIPYGRACSYNEKHPEKFKLCYPYINVLNSYFKELLPIRWGRQKNACTKVDPRYVINDSVYTTLTVNHNWRTAAHLDAGDLEGGFSNICGFGKGWKGGELIAPEYRAAFNIQPGDLLLVANHTAIHGNNELIGEYNDRLTVVAYFREDILGLKSWEYEVLRRQFVDERRLNKSHPLYRKLWNGVSENMWQSDEWREFLIRHNAIDEDGLVDVTGNKVKVTDFF